MIIPDPYELTPIEEVDGLFLKRDDLYKLGYVNGGKLRQAVYLMSKAVQNGAENFLTAASYLSPQIPVVSTVANALGKPLFAFMGCKPETFESSPYALITLGNGTIVKYYRNCPRSSALYARVREYAKTLNNPNILLQGISCFDDRDYFKLLAHQVENCPDADNLLVVCGSSTNAIGILAGIKKFKKRYNRVILFGVAPNREKLIYRTGKSLELDLARFEYVDAYSDLDGYQYEKTYREAIGDIQLHPRYEAKAYRWFRQSGITGKTLYWIVGGEIGVR